MNGKNPKGTVPTLVIPGEETLVGTVVCRLPARVERYRG